MGIQISKDERNEISNIWGILEWETTINVISIKQAANDKIQNAVANFEILLLTLDKTCHNGK